MTEKDIQILKLGEAVFMLSESLRLFEEAAGGYDNVPQDIYERYLFIRDYIETEADVMHGVNDRELFRIGYKSFLDVLF